MKAMLPVNQLVLIIIFLIVLVAAILVISGTVQAPAYRFTDTGKLNQCCWSYKQGGCRNMGTMCDDITIGDLSQKLGLSAEQLNRTCGCG